MYWNKEAFTVSLSTRNKLTFKFAEEFITLSFASKILVIGLLLSQEVKNKAEQKRMIANKKALLSRGFFNLDLINNVANSLRTLGAIHYKAFSYSLFPGFGF